MIKEERFSVFLWPAKDLTRAQHSGRRWVSVGNYMILEVIHKLPITMKPIQEKGRKKNTMKEEKKDGSLNSIFFFWEKNVQFLIKTFSYLNIKQVSVENKTILFEVKNDDDPLLLALIIYISISLSLFYNLSLTISLSLGKLSSVGTDVFLPCNRNQSLFA